MDPGLVPGAGSGLPAAINTANLRHNIGVLSFFRTAVSMVIGIAMGVLGIEGWLGFIPHIASQLLCAPIVALKCGAGSPLKYFHSWSTLLLTNVFSSVTLLTYLLFWMISYNLCHIF